MWRVDTAKMGLYFPNNEAARGSQTTSENSSDKNKQQTNIVHKMR